MKKIAWILPVFFAGILTFIITSFFKFKYHGTLMTTLIVISIILFILGVFWAKLTKKLILLNNNELKFLLNHFSNVKDNIFFISAIVYGITIIISQIDSIYFTFNIKIYSLFLTLKFDFLWFISILICYYLINAFFKIFKALKFIKTLNLFNIK